MFSEQVTLFYAENLVPKKSPTDPGAWKQGDGTVPLCRLVYKFPLCFISTLYT